MAPLQLVNGKVKYGRFLMATSVIMMISGVYFFFDDFQFFWLLDKLVAEGYMQTIIDYSGVDAKTVIVSYYSSLVEGCIQSVLMIITGFLGLNLARGKGNPFTVQIFAILTLSLAVLVFIIVGFIFGFENIGMTTYLINIAIPSVFYIALKRESSSTYWSDIQKAGMQTVSEVLQAQKMSTSNCTITIRPTSITGTLAIPIVGNTDFFRGDIETIESNLMMGSFSTETGSLVFKTDDARFQDLLDGFKGYMQHERNEAIIEIAPVDELLVFLYYIIKDDSSRLSNWRDSLHILEDIVNEPDKDIPHDFERYISNARNELYMLERFYEQIVEVCQTLSITPLVKINDICRSQFDILAARAKRYALEAAQAADYAMQVRELRQSRQGAKQTEISTVLTVVATVCMSVSLITGWYGMNFANMPELQNRLAYLIIILLCMIVVTGELVFFKRKKWF